MKLLAKIVCLSLTVGCLLLPAMTNAQEEDRVDLSLNQCLMMALENNLKLVSARYAPRMADSDVTASEAAFDIGFESSFTHRQRQQGTTQPTVTSSSTTDSMNVGIQQDLSYGANYTASFFSQHRAESGGFTLPSSTFSSFSLNYTQPILRGFGTDVITEQLVLARSNAAISRHDLKTTAELITEQVEGAYWDIVAAREALRIERLSLTRAQKLLDQNRRKVEVGSLAPIEITQAEAGVASQEESVIVTETGLLDAEDELRRLMGVPASDPMWGKSIYNLDAPQFRTREVDLEQALAVAMHERSELRSRRQTVINRELSEKVARRQLRNQLDFNVRYAPQGLSPTALSPTSDFGESLDVIFDGDEFDWQASLTY